MQLGKRTFRGLLLASLLPAAVPLGIKASRRLRNLLFRNPRTIDDVRIALDAVVQRAAIMEALVATDGTAERPRGESAAGEDDLVHVSAADCSSPSRTEDGAVAVVAGAGSDSVAEARPEGRSGLVELAQPAAAPPDEGVVAVESAGADGSTVLSETASR